VHSRDPGSTDPVTVGQWSVARCHWPVPGGASPVRRGVPRRACRLSTGRPGRATGGRSAGASHRPGADRPDRSVLFAGRPPLSAVPRSGSVPSLRTAFMPSNRGTERAGGLPELGRNTARQGLGSRLLSWGSLRRARAARRLDVRASSRSRPSDDRGDFGVGALPASPSKGYN
jgi:hypothetical protein